MTVIYIHIVDFLIISLKNILIVFLCYDNITKLKDLII